MAKIRVNPQHLLTNSYSICNIADALEQAASAVENAAGSAPSYNGQFGPKVRQIGLAAHFSGTKKSDATRGNGQDLRKRAEHFQIADNGHGFSNLELLLATQAGWKDIPDWERKWDSLLEKIGKIGSGASKFLFGIDPSKVKSWWDETRNTIQYYTTYQGSSVWSSTKNNTKSSLFKINECSFFPFLDLKNWSAAGSIFSYIYNDKKNGKAGDGDLYKFWDKDKSVLENLRDKLKVNIPLIQAGGSIFSRESSNEKRDQYGNVISREEVSLDVGKVNISGKISIGGSDIISAEIGGEATLASGKYEKVWGKEDDFIQPTLSSEVTVGKVGGSAKISKDGVEAKVGVTLIEGTVSGGANIGKVNVGASVTARVGWEWGFKAKKGEFSIDIGPFSIGLKIGKRK